MKSGFLVYKCRRCGKTSKKTHVPDGLMVVISIMNDIPLPKHLMDAPTRKTDLCNCDDGHLGISDIIGFEED